MSSEKRRYELKARAERQAETRRRIVKAAVQLHEEVGPAQTTVAEIARRSGVQRLTVYNHFPDEAELFAACQSHFLARHPPPDPTRALALENPRDRLAGVLREFYAWYRETEAMSGNVQRDRAVKPALDTLVAEFDAQLAGLAQALSAGLAAKRKRAWPVQALVTVALDFWTWKRLAAQGLDDTTAGDLMADAVACVAAR